MRTYQRRFREMKRAVLSERVRDVQDMETRLLRNVPGRSGEDLSRAAEPAIVVAHDVIPIQTAQSSPDNVLGLVTDKGGKTSQTAILAQALGIPAVVGCNRPAATATISGGDTVVIDGTRGIVIVDPDPETLRHYGRDSS